MAYMLSRSRILLCSQCIRLYSHEVLDIPKRIPRGPTDILRALEATVGRDPTAAHYKYHDDPYLIPTSNINRRSFAMAKESGRKTAQFIRAEHADLFQHKVAVPAIKQFEPDKIFNEQNANISVQDLQEMIDEGQTSRAKQVYDILVARNVPIDAHMKVQLLELMCFRNSQDAVPEDLIEERWFRQAKLKEVQRKTWRENGFAEQLFIELECAEGETTDFHSRIYSAIIQGMARYLQVDRAFEFFKEAMSKQLPLNTNTINALIRVVHLTKEDYELRWQATVELLQQMKQLQLRPNVSTLNAVLEACSHSGGSHSNKQNVLATLAEFQSLNISPSLASWYFVLTVFCRNRGPPSTILHDIMDHIENKEFSIVDPYDTEFFTKAMDVCRMHLNDVELAKRVNKLLHYGTNYNLIGDSFKESIYFRNYLCLLCTNVSFEEFMRDTYSVLVPNIYVPELGVMLDVIRQADVSGAIEFIPRLWSDLIIFDHAHREEVIDNVLNAIVNNIGLLEAANTMPLEKHCELQSQLANIAWSAYEQHCTTSQEEKAAAEDAAANIRSPQDVSYRNLRAVHLNGKLLGHIVWILLKCGCDYERASQVMQTLENEQQKIVGVPNIEALQLFLDINIERKEAHRAIDCVQYTMECGHQEALAMARKLKNSLNLDPAGEHMKRLSDTFGNIV